MYITAVKSIQRRHKKSLIIFYNVYKLHQYTEEKQIKLAVKSSSNLHINFSIHLYNYNIGKSKQLNGKNDRIS